MRKKATFTLDPETIRRFDQIVALRHCSKSQCITDWVWTTKLPDEDEQKIMVHRIAYDSKTSRCLGECRQEIQDSVLFGRRQDVEQTMTGQKGRRICRNE